MPLDMSPVVESKADPILVEDLRVLKAARTKIAKPENWCKGSWAQDAAGRDLEKGWAENAVRFCAIGAISDVTGESVLNLHVPALLGRAYLRLQDGVSGHTIGFWNDAPSTTHGDVLDLFDRTIAKLEAQL